MEDSTHARPSRGAWRWGTPLVFVLSGALFAVSAADSDGTDLRPSRYTDLASFVQHEADEATRLTARFNELSEEVDALAARIGDDDVDQANVEIEQLYDPAGLTPKSGPGVTITLNDAPQEVMDSSTEDPNDLVVHQQHIQAVVNAMWRGGAEAVTIQGQRVIATTGIKCSGSTVRLQGVPYAPPYVITAVGGDPADVLYSLERDGRVSEYRQMASNPRFALGYESEIEEFVTAPAFDGLTDRQYAEPMSQEAAAAEG